MGKVPHVHLPPGYRVEWVEGRLSLFGSGDRLVATYPAGADVLLTIEERAWQDAVRQLHRETAQEIKEFRAGAIPVEGLYRMRQYVGLLGALADVAAAPPVTRPAPEPTRLFRTRRSRARRVVVAASVAVAALLALVIFSGDTLTPPSVEVPPSVNIPPSEEVPTLEAKVVAPAEVAAPEPQPKKAADNLLVAPPVPAPPVRQISVSAPIRRRVKVVFGYATTFGRFATLKAAQISARSVRSKGYIATVVRAGRSFQVLSRTYHTRAEAERWAGIFQEIGLPATVQPSGL